MVLVPIKDKDFIFRRYNVELEGPAIPIEDTPEVKAAVPKDEPFKSVAMAVVIGDTDAAISKVKDALKTIKPLELIEKGLAKGMDAVGALYASGTYFLPNVMVSADAMMAGIAECEKALGKAAEKKGKVVCHVAEGDPHDIGKNMLVMFLRAAGYDVTDLGRDVPVETVVDAVKKEKPIWLTGTALMTTTMSNFPKIADKLKAAGIDIPFGCGGGAVSKDWVETFDLGFFGDKAYHGPKLADAILKGMSWKDLRIKYNEVVGEYATAKGW
ncbi:MAG: cobalamin-dependent protein [Nitrososphaerales archaeon]